ncbi:MAG: helix-hairpin-helix domain-containing protein [Candidatus Bathyarchaeia archaeon]
MRSDYALYTVAVIFFIITLAVVATNQEPKGVWIVATTVIGFLFIGLGYTQRPKAQTAMQPLPTPTSTPPSVTETAKEEKTEIIVEAASASMPLASELTKVKGIGAKRSEQLKAIGINTIEQLSEASAEDLASKLKISPKITGKWIDEAKKLTKEA